MWILQVFPQSTFQLITLFFKEEASAVTVMEAITKNSEASESSHVKDDFGAQVFIPKNSGSPVFKLEKNLDVMEAQIELKMDEMRGQARLQKKLQGDQTLKFLQGGQMGPRLMS